MPKKSSSNSSKQTKKLSKDNNDTLDSFIDKEEEEPATEQPSVSTLDPISNNEQISPNRRYIYKDGSTTTVVYDGKNPTYVEVKYSKT
jgi:hypothetical protein